MAGHTSMAKTTQQNNYIVGGVHVKEGRHVDGVDGHHVEVGVGVLPSRKRRRCYSGL